MLQPRLLSQLATAKCGLGCPTLTQFLSGGLPCRSITELAGEATASKTQLCLQLLLAVQLPPAHGGLGGSAVYVYTEGDPAMGRLNELASLWKYRAPPEAFQGLSQNPMDNIFIEKGLETGQDLLARLHRLRLLLESRRRGDRPVRLLVVDSIAYLFRDMGDNAGVGELASRTEALFQISALLRRYADDFNLAVLTTNQIMDSVTEGGAGAAAHATGGQKVGHTGGLRLMSLGREVIPALGLAWANCINTRIFLSKCTLPDGTTPAAYHGEPSAALAAATAAGAVATGRAGVVAAPALRRMQVVFSPHLPQSEVYYVVEATGVRGLHPAEFAEVAQQQQQQQLLLGGPPPPQHHHQHHFHDQHQHEPPRPQPPHHQQQQQQFHGHHGHRGQERQGERSRARA